MTKISFRGARNRLTAFAHGVEQGEAIAITGDGNGGPIIAPVPIGSNVDASLEAIDAFKREYNVEQLVALVAEDFDAPIPDDFLIGPGG